MNKKEIYHNFDDIGQTNDAYFNCSEQKRLLLLLLLQD